jgi:hypothetical protein
VGGLQQCYASLYLVYVVELIGISRQVVKIIFISFDKDILCMYFPLGVFLARENKCTCNPIS